MLVILSGCTITVQFNYDTFTQGEDLKFTGIPNFAPELFRRIRLKDPSQTQNKLLKIKRL